MVRVIFLECIRLGEETLIAAPLAMDLRTRGLQAVDDSRGGGGNRLGQLVDEFTPLECRNDFKHCGYTAHEQRKCSRVPRLCEP